MSFILASQRGGAEIVGDGCKGHAKWCDKENQKDQGKMRCMKHSENNEGKNEVLGRLKESTKFRVRNRKQNN